MDVKEFHMVKIDHASYIPNTSCDKILTSIDLHWGGKHCNYQMLFGILFPGRLADCHVPLSWALECLHNGTQP